MSEEEPRYILHPGWLRANRYVGQAELLAYHHIDPDADVIVLDGTRHRRFYGLPHDVHYYPESIERRTRDPR